MKFLVQRYNSIPAEDGCGAAITGTEDTVVLDCKELARSTPLLACRQHVDANSYKEMKSDAAQFNLCDSLGSETTGPTISNLHQYMNPVARRGRLFANRQRQRLVSKDGECNVSITKVSARKRKFLVDIFTTLIDMKWRYNLIMFPLTFITSWLLFAVIWWIMSVIHQDHLHANDENWQPCVVNVYDFTTALLFSIETQHTIGYGSRSVNTKCPLATVVLMCQSCIGVFIQSLVTGLIFAKLSRPKRRGQTIMFSKNAVISQRDGEVCMLFRVGDMRKSHIVGTTIRAMMVKNRLTKEGELLPLCQENFEVETEVKLPDKYLFMGWPVTIVHRINKDSPLWDTSAEELVTERFEIIVILEGTVESTGMTAQVRTSYLPTEILWGHRLRPLVTEKKESGMYEINYSHFHSTIPISMPDCSAKMMSGSQAHIANIVPFPDYPLSFTAPSVMVQTPVSSPKRRRILKRKPKGIDGNGRLGKVNALARPARKDDPRVTSTSKV